MNRREFEEWALSDAEDAKEWRVRHPLSTRAIVGRQRRISRLVEISKDPEMIRKRSETLRRQYAERVHV